MAAEKAQALVVRTTDWSETSRIATLWTKELGKVRVLAKGGRRLKSNFESALDLLTVCDIVLLRKTSGSLDLLTEARVRERFGPLRRGWHGLNWCCCGSWAMGRRWTSVPAARKRWRTTAWRSAPRREACYARRAK